MLHSQLMEGSGCFTARKRSVKKIVIYELKSYSSYTRYKAPGDQA
jgi:hypothetical protein